MRNLLILGVADGSLSALLDPRQRLLNPYRTRDLCPVNLCPVRQFSRISAIFTPEFDDDFFRGTAEVAGPNQFEYGTALRWYTCVRNGTQGASYGNRKGWYERVPR